MVRLTADAAVLILPLLASACAPIGRLRDALATRTPYGDYVPALRAAGLHHTSLGGAYEPEEDGTFLVRIQPELLDHGRLTLAQRQRAADLAASAFRHHRRRFGPIDPLHNVVAHAR